MTMFSRLNKSNKPAACLIPALHHQECSCHRACPALDALLNPTALTGLGTTVPCWLCHPQGHPVLPSTALLGHCTSSADGHRLICVLICTVQSHTMRKKKNKAPFPPFPFSFSQGAGTCLGVSRQTLRGSCASAQGAVNPEGLAPCNFSVLGSVINQHQAPKNFPKSCPQVSNTWI